MTTLTNAPWTQDTTLPDDDIEIGVDVADPSPEPEPRRKLSNFGRTDRLALFGAFVGSLAFTGLIFTLAPFSGLLGFLVVAYILFLTLYAVLVSIDDNGPTVKDRIASVVIHSLAGVMMVALVVVVVFTFWRGRDALANLNFFYQDMSEAGPLEPLSVGGVGHAIIGTLQMIGLALLITVPLGLTTAVFLTQVPGRFSRFVRTLVEAMTALPSIVAGLFIYAAVIIVLGLPKSGFAAALALSVMMLPIIIRAADVVLRLVPGSLTEAALALGAPQWRVVWHVVLPTARSGLATAVILGTARGIGETSPVLLTAGFTTFYNNNAFEGPQVSLPLYVFNAVRSPEPTFIARGFGAAAVLMLLVVGLFVIARIIGGRGAGQLSKRQTRRAAAASRRDVARWATRRPQAAVPTPAPDQVATIDRTGGADNGKADS